MENVIGSNSSKVPPMGLEIQESFAQRVFDTALTVDKYYTPVLFLVGTLGNSLSLVVFSMNAKYRNQSASYYLSALAISDTGFLVNLLAVWLESVHGGVITSGLLCPLVMYLGQVTCFISVYLTVAFSIERFVAVHYPLSRPRICTRSKARKVIAALTGVALLVFSYAWVIAQVIELPVRRDDYDESYQDVLPENSLNLTQNDSFELPRDERRVKRESFPLYALHTQESLTSHKKTSSKQLNNVFSLGCGKGSPTIYNESLPFRTQNESQNCGRFHSDGAISKRFDNSFSLGAADRDTSTSVKNVSGVMNADILSLDRSGEDEERFLSDGGGGYICSVPEDYYRISEIANYLDSVVTLIIPFFLITFFNVRIAICVWKLKDQRDNIVASTTTNINYHNNHHNSSLRCSTKYSMYRLKNLKKTQEEQRNHHRDNGIIQDGSLETNISPNQRKSQKGTVRFHDGGNSLKPTGQGNGSPLSTSESEESRLADNSRDDDNPNLPSGCGSSQNPEITLTTNRMSSSEGLGNRSTKIIRTPISSDQVAKGLKMKWEQEFTEHGSQRVAVKPELSVVKERGSGHHPSSNASEVRVTKTLLLVSSVFLVLNLPAHAIRCALFIQSLRGTSDGNELLHAVQPWTNILFNTNFAVNFFLYCLSGRNFRKSLRNLILRKFNKSKTNAWKPVKTGLKNENNSKQVAGGGLNRNCIKKELRQVTEIVELENVGEESIYPMPTQPRGRADASSSEEEESMNV